MKRKAIIFVCLLLTLCLYGCSHKSESELVDVEQFRCQDSIDMVFDELGVVDMDEMFRCYIYDDRNVFGYKGDITFYVREDGKTIEYFSCLLKLNDEEFEDIVAYLSEKYDPYGDGDCYLNDKCYRWTTSPEDGRLGYLDDEVGYDEIHIYAADTKGLYFIKFSDEWSKVRDTEYFESLEVAQNSKDIVVLQREYNVCGNTMGLAVEILDGKPSFVFSVQAKEKKYADAIGRFLFPKTEIIEEMSVAWAVDVCCEGEGCLAYGWNGVKDFSYSVNLNGTIFPYTPDWWGTERELLSEREYVECENAVEQTWSEFIIECDKTIN